jgi:hypothetical protein
MAYRNKTYVAFDADSDIRYFHLMQVWKQNDNSSFNFYNAHDSNNIWDQSMEQTIKRRLRERFNDTKIFVLLVGEKTKFLYRFVRWEIETALNMGLPIIVLNLNGKRSMDLDKCPPLLTDKLALHISFNSKIIQKALEDWKDIHERYVKEGKTGAYYFKDNVYQKLGL